MVRNLRVLAAAALVSAVSAACAVPLHVTVAGSRRTPTAAARATSAPTAPANHGVDGHAGDSAPPADPADSEPGRPGTNAFDITTKPATGEVAGYTDPMSAVAGSPVQLYVSSTAPTVRLQAYRIGGYTGGRGRLVWSGHVRGEVQAPVEIVEPTRTAIAPWHPTIALDTGTWPAGFYLIKLTASTGGQYDVPFVVRSASLVGRVALVLPTHTWEAYNGWGGYSLYGKGMPRILSERSYAVSYDRPFDWPGLGDFAYSAEGFVSTAEAARVPLAYLTDVDIENHPGILAGAKGLVSVGHDEYWSLTRRNAWDAARDAGTNILITGANTMYWRVRSRPGIDGTGPGRLVVGYKSRWLDPEATTDPAEAGALWINEPDPQPQDTSTGLLYECFPVDTSFTVTAPQWWGYAGTHATAGEQFARLVGVEADRVYPLTTRPRPMQVLANQPYSCNGRPTSAQAIQYAAPSGAVVVNLNSLRWTCALEPDCTDGQLSSTTRAFARRVTLNVLQAFVLGPVAQRHPVTDDVASYFLPSYRTVYPNPD